MPRLAIGIAPIALELAGCFVLDNASDTVFFNQFPRFDLSPGCRYDHGFACGRFFCNPSKFIALDLLTLCAPRFPCLGKSQAFRLFCCTVGSAASFAAR